MVASLRIIALSVLIESDWNLKTFVWNKVTNQNEVLIESDWNLKTTGGNKMRKQIIVLIESDWNLKSCKRIHPSTRRLSY